MITLFHIGPKGFNIGNHAIGLAMRAHLSRAFGQVVNLISIPATSRYETHGRAGLTASTVHQINQFGDGVIVGGGNLYENGELEVDLNALRALERPLMLFSLSWGRIYNARNEMVRRTDSMPDEVITALNRAAAVSLARDSATLQHLHEIGASEARLGGCPTLELDRERHRIPKVTFGDERLAVVSVRKPSLMNVPLQLQARIYGDVTFYVQWLRKEGYEVRLLCHDHRDIDFAASFPDVEFIYTDDVFTFLGVLRAAAFNLTYRLHSALPCVAFDRPFIKLSYDERSLSLMETIGLGEWNINIVTEKDPMQAILDRYSRLEEMATLRASVEPIWRDLHDTVAAAFDDFAGQVRQYQGG